MAKSRVAGRTGAYARITGVPGCWAYGRICANHGCTARCTVLPVYGQCASGAQQKLFPGPIARLRCAAPRDLVPQHLSGWMYVFARRGGGTNTCSNDVTKGSWAPKQRNRAAHLWVAVADLLSAVRGLFHHNHLTQRLPLQGNLHQHSQMHPAQLFVVQLDALVVGGPLSNQS